MDGRFVVSGAGGTILTSDDGGTNWVARVSSTTQYLSSVAAGNGLWVVVGNAGTVLTSDDGVEWETQSSGTSAWLSRVRFLDGEFFALGDNGTILRSLDGVSWISESSGTGNWLNDIVRLTDTNETYFAVGNQGVVLSSTNASDWQSAGSITSKSLYAASHNSDGMLLVAGLEGAILRSQITPFTNAIEIVEYSHGQTQSSFLFSGKTGQQFRLERSGTFSNWVSGEVLEFLDGTGTLIYIEPNGPEQPEIEFYRSNGIP